VLSQVNDLLLNLAALTIRAHGLVVGAALFTLPLDLNRSYVDGANEDVRRVSRYGTHEA
jgi:hypothetical protein